jgi:hypothetical protein
MNHTLSVGRPTSEIVADLRDQYCATDVIRHEAADRLEELDRLFDDVDALIAALVSASLRAIQARQ